VNLWKKAAIAFVAAHVLFIVLLVLWISAQGKVTWPDTPMPDVSVSADPAMIERGAYIVHSLAHCSTCHLPRDEVGDIAPDERVALRGGGEWELPFGTLRSPNLTPDQATGLSDWSDAEIGRAIASGVLRDGSVSMFMGWSLGELAADDLDAVVSYLRSTDPVSNEVPRSELNLLGKALFGGLEPLVKMGRWAEAPPPGPTVERGEYLANGPAFCYGCHSKLDMMAMEILEPLFQGGNPEPAEDGSNVEIVAPNLTPDPETGWIVDWSEDRFVTRLRGGRQREGSKMPWEAFAGMTEDDARAIYRYLQTLEPVKNETGPTVRAPGWSPPG